MNIQFIRKLRRSKKYLEAIKVIDVMLVAAGDDESLELLEESLQISEKIGDRKLIYRFLNQLLEVHMIRGRDIEAWGYAKKIFEGEYKNTIEVLAKIEELASRLGELEERKKITNIIFERAYLKKNLVVMQSQKKRGFLNDVQIRKLEDLRGNYEYFEQSEEKRCGVNPFVINNTVEGKLQKIEEAIAKNFPNKEILKQLFDVCLMAPTEIEVLSLMKTYAKKARKAKLYNLLDRNKVACVELREVENLKNEHVKKERPSLKESYQVYEEFMGRVCRTKSDESFFEYNYIKKWIVELKEEDFKRIWKDLFVCFAQMNLFEIALFVLERADSKIEGRYLRAEIYHNELNFQKCIEVCEELLKGGSDIVIPTYYLMGDAYLRLGKKDIALQVFKKIYEIEGNYRLTRKKIEECLRG